MILENKKVSLFEINKLFDGEDQYFIHREYSFNLIF